jgi:hypothetical protein
MQKGLLLYLVALSSLALSVPSAAQATAKEWRHNGWPLAQKETLQFHGTMNFTSSAGGISCFNTTDMDLEPGSTGKVTSFQPTSVVTCSYSGNLDNLCGVVDTWQTTYSTELPLTMHATRSAGGSYAIVITDLHYDVGGSGFFCPDVTVRGTVIATGNPEGFGTLTLSGTLSSNLGTEVTAGGELHSTPSGTFGMAT